MAKYRFQKPCSVCNRLSLEPQCEAHRTDKKKLKYSGEYSRYARMIRYTATTCHLCGEGKRQDDPFEADHLYPGTPVTDISQLAPAHRTCNNKRGNKPL